MRVMIEDAAKLGYGEYRTHIALQDQVMSTYNWNGGSLVRTEPLRRRRDISR